MRNAETIIDVSGLASVNQVSKITCIDDYSAKEITAIEAVADVAGSLDGTYFVLQDEVGSVAFWIDVDNSGTAAPVHGADRAIEITTIATGDSATDVGTKVYTAIVADTKFEAGADGLDGTFTVQSTTYGAKTSGVDGDTGFTISVDTSGSAGLDGTYFVLQDVAGSVAFWIDLDNSGTAAPTHGADRAVEITTISTLDTAATIAGLLETAIHADSKFTASSATVFVTVTNADLGDMADFADGDTGFTFETTVDGYTQQNVASEGIDLRECDGYHVAITWASTTCVGTFKMQESNDNATWFDVTGGSQAVANNSGSVALTLSGRMAPWVRGIFAYTSGTLTSGTISYYSKLRN